MNRSRSRSPPPLIRTLSKAEDSTDYDWLWENRNINQRYFKEVVAVFMAPPRFNFNKLDKKRNRNEVQLYRAIYRALKNKLNKKRAQSAVRHSRILTNDYANIIYKMLKDIKI